MWSHGSHTGVASDNVELAGAVAVVEAVEDPGIKSAHGSYIGLVANNVEILSAFAVGSNTSAAADNVELVGAVAVIVAVEDSSGSSSRGRDMISTDIGPLMLEDTSIAKDDDMISIAPVIRLDPVLESCPILSKLDNSFAFRTCQSANSSCGIGGIVRGSICSWLNWYRSAYIFGPTQPGSIPFPIHMELHSACRILILLIMSDVIWQLSW
jgi:hypothetical protein